MITPPVLRGGEQCPADDRRMTTLTNFETAFVNTFQLARNDIINSTTN